MNPDIDRNLAISRIREGLKRRRRFNGAHYTVKGGTGTAWGWITINVVPRERGWRHRLPEGMRDLPENYEGYESGQPGGGMNPRQREELAALLGLGTVHSDGVSIPAGFDYYREYIARAWGDTPTVLGVLYWD